MQKEFVAEYCDQEQYSKSYMLKEVMYKKVSGIYVM